MEKKKKSQENLEVKNEEKSEKKESPVNLDKQSLILIGGFAALIVLAVLALIIFRGSGIITYEGVKFIKTTQGKLVFYTAKVPVYDESGNIAKYIEFTFRNNPKTIANIPVSINNLLFTRNGIYTSYGDLKICEDNMLAAVNLDIFLSDFGIKNKRSGLANQSYAKQTNLTNVNCQTNPDNTVLLIKNGNETKIEQTAQNCYEIVSNNCDILKSTERFQLEMIKNYMAAVK